VDTHTHGCPHKHQKEKICYSLYFTWIPPVFNILIEVIIISNRKEIKLRLC